MQLFCTFHYGTDSDRVIKQHISLFPQFHWKSRWKNKNIFASLFRFYGQFELRSQHQQEEKRLLVADNSALNLKSLSLFKKLAVFLIQVSIKALIFPIHTMLSFFWNYSIWTFYHNAYLALFSLLSARSTVKKPLLTKVSHRSVIFSFNWSLSFGKVFRTDCNCFWVDLYGLEPIWWECVLR